MSQDNKERQEATDELKRIAQRLGADIVELNGIKCIEGNPRFKEQIVADNSAHGFFRFLVKPPEDDATNKITFFEYAGWLYERYINFCFKVNLYAVGRPLFEQTLYRVYPDTRLQMGTSGMKRTDISPYADWEHQERENWIFTGIKYFGPIDSITRPGPQKKNPSEPVVLPSK